MMNDIQKRILAEATKFGGSDISKIQSIANTLSEMPMVDSPSSAGTLFGHSATQFEVKMRQVMKKMGYEKGILGMKLYGSLMNIFFANEGKAKACRPRMILGTSFLSPGNQASLVTPAASRTAWAWARSGPSPTITSRMVALSCGANSSARTNARASIT